MKAMKFWIGDDPELSRRVQEALFDAGYTWASGGKCAQYIADAKYLKVDSDGISFGTTAIGFKTCHAEEINIDWMRAKKETVELFGKKYEERVLKERLADCPTIED